MMTQSEELGRRFVDLTSASRETERGISPMGSYHLGNRQKMYHLSLLSTASSQKC